MLGVVLFTIALLFYGIILSGETAIKAFPNSRGFFEKIDAFIEKGAARIFLALVCLIVGIWNLFAPNFIATNAPILGALIPSLILCADSAVIYPAWSRYSIFRMMRKRNIMILSGNIKAWPGS